MSLKLLFGFHAVTVRLKVAPKSIRELHVDATRRDQRMKQFLAKAEEAGLKVIVAGKQAVQFYTQTKTITSRWFEDNQETTGVNTTISLR